TRSKRDWSSDVCSSDLGTASLGLHHPLETHRMTLGHIRTLDDDRIGIGEILLEARGASTAKRRPQTGDGRRVSNTCLILDLKSRSEERRVGKMDRAETA